VGFGHANMGVKHRNMNLFLFGFVCAWIFFSKKQRIIDFLKNSPKLKAWQKTLLVVAVLALLVAIIKSNEPEKQKALPCQPSVAATPTASQSTPAVSEPVTAAKEPAPAPKLTASGKPEKVFTEGDVYWDSSNKKYKALIVKAINKVYRENERCASYQGADISVTQKGTKANPMFYVSCNDQEGSPFNVFVSKSDIESDKLLTAPKHLDRNAAFTVCKKEITKRLEEAQMSSASIYELNLVNFPNGRTRVTLAFDAKNLAGLKITNYVACLLDAKKVHDVTFGVYE
jgi:hypothetical protein